MQQGAPAKTACMRGGSTKRRGGLTPPGAFVVAGGVRVHYVRAGEGPALVYVHGAKGSTYDFTLSLGPRLAERYTAVAMDRPGSGFSGRLPSGENRPEAQAAVLRAAARQLGLERPLLVGHSLGAAVALAWALDAPDEVAAVVTLGAYALPLGGPAAVGGQAAAVPGRAAAASAPWAAPASGARWYAAPSSAPSPPRRRRPRTSPSRRAWRCRPAALRSDGADRQVGRRRAWPPCGRATPVCRCRS